MPCSTKLLLDPIHITRLLAYKPDRFHLCVNSKEYLLGVNYYGSILVLLHFKNNKSDAQYKYSSYAMSPFAEALQCLDGDGDRNCTIQFTIGRNRGCHRAIHECQNEYVVDSFNAIVA